MMLGLGLSNVMARPWPSIFDPLTVPDLGQWFAARDASTLLDAGGAPADDGEAIATWQDKSGNARHATQGTAGSRPLRVASGINGRGSVAFNGTRALGHTYAMPGAACTLFMVVDASAGAAYRGIYSTHGDGDLAQTRIYSRLVADKWGTYSGSDQAANTAISGAGKKLLTVVRVSGGGVTFRLNGTADGTAVGSTGVGGNIGGSLFYTQGFIGQIAEVLVWPRTLTADEITYVETGLRRLYGV